MNVVQFKSDVTFDADSLVAKSDDGDKANARLPTFHLTAYNGGKMKPSGYQHPVVVALDGVDHDGRIPIFLDHDSSGRGLVGHAEVTVGNAISADGIVSADTESARLVVESAKRGFPWQVSIGANVGAKQFVKASESLVVNGIEHTGPFYHISKSHLHEISFVPIGADGSTSANIAARRRQNMADEDKVTPDANEPEEQDTGKKMDPMCCKWIEAQGFKIEELSEERLETLTLAYETQREEELAKQRNQSQEDLIAQMRTATAKEISRQSKIRELTRFNAELQAKAISEGWSPTETELHILRTEYQSKRPKSVSASHRNSTLSPRVIEAAVCNQLGMGLDWLDAKHEHWKTWNGYLRGYSEQELDAAADAGSYSFGRLFHEFLYANGVSIAPGTTIAELIPKVKDTHRIIRASTGFSTFDLSSIMSNALNKQMLAMFETVRPVAQRISASRSVPDFKESKAFRMTGNGDFLEIGPTGELQSMQLQEEEFSNRPKTYGRLISVSRQMLINDDMGALAGVTRVLGRKAALILQKVFFELWVDTMYGGAAFWTVARGNYHTNALDIAGLTAGERLFMVQTDADSDPIDIEPAILLVPADLKVTAEELMNGTTTVMWAQGALGGNQATYVRGPDINPHVGKWVIEWSPWLTYSGYTSEQTAGAATYWWLLADPNLLASAEIVYLNGRRTPTIESEDSDFSTLGFQWRSYFDFGVAQQDYRGSVMSLGTT